MINVKIDKENEHVAYNDKDHVYWIKGSDLKCISVTTLVGQYCQPFDHNFWSTYKSLERIMGFRFKPPRLPQPWQSESYRYRENLPAVRPWAVLHQSRCTCRDCGENR